MMWSGGYLLQDVSRPASALTGNAGGQLEVLYCLCSLESALLVSTVGDDICEHPAICS